MEQRTPRPKGKFRFAPTLQLEASLSLAAFLMSLAITLINVYYSFRGAELAVDPPAQLILFRDGEGDSSILTGVVRVEMINVADGYGDVLKQASLSFDGGKTSFDYGGTVRTVFTSGDQKAADCELGFRCLQLPGLYVIERTDEILDVPSGAARAFGLSFPLIEWNCSSRDKAACPRFATFADTLSAMGPKTLSATVTVKFHGDGARTLKCATGPVNRQYLEQVGWVSLSCENGKA